MSCRGGARRPRTDEARLTDQEYIQKRKRNNDAVNRTRQRKREEESNTLSKVEELRKENAELEKMAEGLRRELAFLKEMFTVYASSDRKRSEDSAAKSSPPDSTTP